MPLVKKSKQVTVDVSEITLELDEHLTAKVEKAAASSGSSPEDYIISLLGEHFKQMETAALSPIQTKAITEVGSQPWNSIFLHEITDAEIDAAEAAQALTPKAAAKLRTHTPTGRIIGPIGTERLRKFVYELRSQK